MTKHITEICLKNLRRINGDQAKTHCEQDAEPAGTEAQWLRLSRVNLFIGRNGTGKSTVLDMVHCIRDPGLLGTMPRENMNRFMRSYFALRGDAFTVRVDFPNFTPHTNEYKHGTHAYCQVQVSMEVGSNSATYSAEFRKFARDDARCRDVAFWDVPMEVHHSREAYETVVLEDHHLAELNLIAHMLKGTLGGDHEERAEIVTKLNKTSPAEVDEFGLHSGVRQRQRTPLMLGDGGDAAYMYSGDDESQWQVVSLSHVPSGWLAYAKLTGWLNGGSVPDGSICLIEEPETHLHPAFQRALIRRINEISIQKNLQLLIASHSPLFINMATANPDATLFSANARNQLAIVEVPELLLHDLGVHGSDILQTNGVIWVEGESDKIYLQYWIDEIVARDNIQISLDYEICEYGGANLAHFAVSDDRQFTQLRRMNQNLLVLFDRDNDFQLAENGSPRLVNPSCYKAAVWGQLASSPEAALVTDGYTIEDYLPPEFFSEYFERQEDGRVACKMGKSKVAIARQFTRRGYTLEDHAYSNELIAKLRHVVNCLIQWNA